MPVSPELAYEGRFEPRQTMWPLDCHIVLAGVCLGGDEFLQCQTSPLFTKLAALAAPDA
jgi:hypothetical protein